jgi:hypothetical protein
LNGVIQEPGVSYSINNSNIVFADAPEALSTFFGVQLGSTGSVGSIPADDSISSNKLQTNSVTTVKINDEAATSAKLSSNLEFRGVTTFLGGSIEKANVVSGGASSTIVIDNQESGVVYFTDNTIGNITITVNFTGLSTVATGNVSSYALILTNNDSVQGYVSSVEVDGAAANVLRWQTEAPDAGAANIDSYAFSVIKTAPSTYTVLASKSNFN